MKILQIIFGLYVHFLKRPQLGEKSFSDIFFSGFPYYFFF